jgi:hypothetical protein
MEDSMHTTRIGAHRSRSPHPVSADRAPGYDRPSDVSVQPEKFFDYQISLAKVCPETALMYGVLEDAFLCFHKQFETDGQPNRQAQQAEQWFFRGDSDWLFSFVSVCKALGLEPNVIRHGLRHWNQASLDIPPRKT